MKSSNAIDKIMPALTKAREQIGAVYKSGDNTFDKYYYAKLEDYCNASVGPLLRHGLSIVTALIADRRLEDRTTAKGGTEHVIQVILEMTLLHESGQWLSIEVLGIGQDRADKDVYKAITGARKYGIAMLLNLVTTDDPEGDTSVGQAEAKPKEPKVNVGKIPAKQAKAMREENVKQADQERQQLLEHFNGPKYDADGNEIEEVPPMPPGYENAKPSLPPMLASDEQLVIFADLLGKVNMPAGLKELWLKKAGVDTWSKMLAADLQKCIKWLKDQPKPK